MSGAGQGRTVTQSRGYYTIRTQMSERGRTQKSGVGCVNNGVDLDRRDVSSAVRQKCAPHRDQLPSYIQNALPRREGSAIDGCRYRRHFSQETQRPWHHCDSLDRYAIQQRAGERETCLSTRWWVRGDGYALVELTESRDLG